MPIFRPLAQPSWRSDELRAFPRGGDVAASTTLLERELNVKELTSQSQPPYMNMQEFPLQNPRCFSATQPPHMSHLNAHRTFKL